MVRQRLGQHFLTDASWRGRILSYLPDTPNDTWVEVGAGRGEMTELLAGKGRRVIAIETDPRLVEPLRERAREWPEVVIVAGDVLALNFSELTRERFHVYGNLPYYITSPILHRLFGFAERILSIHVVVQWEVAERIVAPPGRRAHGYLSACCQFYTRPEIALRIPPGAFRPPPKVTSALLTMRLPGERAELSVGREAEFMEFIQTCFGQKRKTLRNNLKNIATPKQVESALAECGISGETRAEQLTLREFAALFSALAEQSACVASPIRRKERRS